MCLLVVCSPGSTPKKADLTTASCANPHGFGFALIAGDQIITYRSMSAKKTINKFLSLRSQHPDGYAIWHARYATHGVKNEFNCHPFQVGGDSLSYLAHNGVLDTHIEDYDKRSDSRIFAEDTLPKLGGVSSLDDPNIWIMVSEWARGSKIAILTLNPQAKHQLYLINSDSGHWDKDGIWWSNYSYVPVAPPKTVGYSSIWKAPKDYTPLPVSDTKPDNDYLGLAIGYDPIWDMYTDAKGDMLEECPNCAGLTSYSDTFCQVCDCCYDCFAPSGACLCYTPQGYRDTIDMIY